MTGRHQSVEVVEYEERWEAAQSTFAARNWPGKLRRSNPDYLRWEYRGSKIGPVPALLLAVEGGEVIGQLGAIPGTAMLGSTPRDVQWIGNLMVDPHHRRRGVMSALFERAVARPLVTFGTDPSPSAARTMSTFGFEKHNASVLMVLALNAGPVFAARYPRARRASRLLSMAGTPIVRYSTRDLRRSQLDLRAQGCSWRDVIADVAAAEEARASAGSLHDEAFLAWRCAGFAPWTKEVDAVRSEGGSFALLESAGNRMLVLQWHGRTSSDTAAVLGKAVYVAEGYGMDYIQAMAGTGEEVARLQALGFKPRRTPTELWAYPAASIGDGPFVVQGYDTDQNL